MREWRPVVLRRVCWAGAATLVAVFAGLTLALRHGAGGQQVTDGNLVAFFGLGLLLAAGVLLLARPRVRADDEVVVVRGVFTERRVPWHDVLAVRFARGEAWATLQMPHDEDLALLAVQAADGPRAGHAVRELRQLHRAARERAGRPVDPSGSPPLSEGV